VLFHGILTKLDHALERLERLEFAILKHEERLMSALDDLAAQVKLNTSLEASAVQLIQGLANQIAQVAGDPARTAALAQELKTSADALAAAIKANTPASAPPPAPAPAPTPAPAAPPVAK
jgi:hypothetical protein